MTGKPVLRRKGERLSVKAVEVLKQLSMLDEYEWTPLACHARIIRSLIVRDYIDWSTVTGITTYKLSKRGRDVLPVFVAPPLLGYQGDVCAQCGQNERHTHSNGTRSRYCLECINVNDAQCRNALCDKPCPRCGKPRAKSQSGRYGVYCVECKREMNVKTKSRLAERVRAGEMVMCTHCHENPVHVAGNTVYNECKQCRYERHRRSIYERVMGSKRG